MGDHVPLLPGRGVCYSGRMARIVGRVVASVGLAAGAAGSVGRCDVGVGRRGTWGPWEAGGGPCSEGTALKPGTQI